MNQDNWSLSCKSGTNDSNASSKGLPMHCRRAPGKTGVKRAKLTCHWVRFLKPFLSLKFKNLFLTKESRESQIIKLRKTPKDDLAQWFSTVMVNKNHLKTFKKQQCLFLYKVPINLKGLKWYRACSVTTTELNQKEISKVPNRNQATDF